MLTDISGFYINLQSSLQGCMDCLKKKNNKKNHHPDAEMLLSSFLKADNLQEYYLKIQR